MKFVLIRVILCLFIVPIAFYAGAICRIPFVLSERTVVNNFFSFDNECVFNVKKSSIHFFTGGVSYEINVFDADLDQITESCRFSSDLKVYIEFGDEEPVIHYFSYNDVEETMGCLSFEKFSEFESKDAILGKPRIFQL